MPTRITILVGTMTGTAQLCAQEMELALDDGETRVEALLMDGLDSSVFQRDGLFLVCTSTYGQGDVPDNARALYEDLQRRRPRLAAAGAGSGAGRTRVSDIGPSRGMHRCRDYMQYNACQQEKHALSSGCLAQERRNFARTAPAPGLSEARIL
jgi:flavodoxin